MDEEVPTTSHANENAPETNGNTSEKNGNEANVSETNGNRSHKKHKKKSKGSNKTSKIVPTYENQRDIFSDETLEQIRIFREARSNWLKSKEPTEDALSRPSQLFFGEEYPRKTPWYKLLKKRPTKKSSMEDLGKVEEGLEEDEAKDTSLDEEKPIKGILKKKELDQEEEEEEELPERPFDREVLGLEDFREDVRLRDDMDYDSDRVEHIREKRGIRIKDDSDLGESEYYREGKPFRFKDDLLYEKERKREREIKKSKEKLLQFKKIPGPEDQCKCEHSGEYTVLVKGVCFCEKPIRPTCIPIIPPAYLIPKMADTLEPDAELGKVDSLELTRRSFERSSSPKENKMKSEKSFKWKWGRKDKEKKEAKLVEIFSRPDEKFPEPKPDKTEVKSTKSVQDMKLDFSTHHRAHVKSDHHAPLHFEDLSVDDEDRKSDSEKDQPGPQTPPDKLPPFLRKATQISSEHSKHPIKQPPKEPIAAKPILEKDKKPKAEHGHVHFSPENEYADDDWDSSKYYTKYGQAADNYKRKIDKTVMTALIETVTEWWKGKSKD